MANINVNHVHAMYEAIAKCAADSEMSLEEMVLAVAANLGRSTVHASAEMAHEFSEGGPQQEGDETLSLMIGYAMRAFWSGVRAGEAGMAEDEPVS
jgi:hypothetical protein